MPKTLQETLANCLGYTAPREVWSIRWTHYDRLSAVPSESIDTGSSHETCLPSCASTCGRVPPRASDSGIGPRPVKF